jgi:hypothetical protein
MDSMSEIWLAWQGREINSDVRLGRYLGGSDHSAVFLGDPAAVAIKLVPAWSALAESQLSDWESAAGLTHPHLIRLLETGRCVLDGQPCLYAVMEYADQNLAQLLRHRALSEVEVREVLPPTLDALAYLHGRNLVQGQLKPANILAVGDRLKLAADTIRRVSEARGGRGEASEYDPPEARDGSYAAAGDIWGLGLTLVEALTRSRPATVSEGPAGVLLPRDFPPTFRELVTRCLSRRPYDRPKVTEIEAWLRRQPAAAARVEPRKPAAVAEAVKPEPVPPPTEMPKGAPAPAAPAPLVPQPFAPRPIRADFGASEIPRRRSLALPIIAIVAILALSWAGMRALRTHRAPASPAAAAAVSQTAAPPATAPAPVPAAQPSPPAPAQAGSAATPVVVHAEIPDVPVRARNTIHGHIKVSVRVIVDKNGNVVGALADRPGPSRYFARLAIAASKKWTFPPVNTQAQRVYAVHFVFSRDGTTGHAAAIS